MFRFLMLGLLALFGWLVGRALRSGAAPRRGPATRGQASPERAGGPMVRDRVCNTFLPRADAQSLSLDGREFHFCSDRCRERFLRERDRSTGPAA